MGWWVSMLCMPLIYDSCTTGTRAQTDEKLPPKHRTCAAAHCMAGTAETKWPLATNWSRRIARNVARRHTYSYFPYKQKYNTLLKVRTGVTPKYDCTRQLLYRGKACTAPRAKEQRAPGNRRAHKSHKTHSRSVQATFTHNHRTSRPLLPP